MRSLSIFSLFLAIVIGGCRETRTPVNEAGPIVFVANPTTREHQRAARECIEKLILESASGMRIAVLEAPELKHLATITIPAGPPANRAVDHQVEEALRKLTPLLLSERPPGGGQLNLPGLAAAIQHVVPAGAEKPTIILAGSPVFDEPRFRGDSWKAGVVPRDGYFFDENSPLCRGLRDFPAGSTLRILYPPEGFGVDAAHQAAIETTWRKFSKRYGGELTRFTSEPDRLLGEGPSQYTDTVTLNADDPCELYVAAAQTSSSLAVQIGNRRTSAQGSTTQTRNQVLQQLASTTHGFTLLVDHSASLTALQDAQGNNIASPEREAEFNQLREKLAVLLERVDAELINVIGFGVLTDTELAAGWPNLMPATPENRAEAGKRLRSWEIGKGTPTLAALQLALADPHCTRIVLVTDGMPNEGQAVVLDWLAQARSVRPFEIYTIGVGNLGYGGAIGDKADWPVREFLQALALENNGAFVEWNINTAGGTP